MVSYFSIFPLLLGACLSASVFESFKFAREFVDSAVKRVQGPNGEIVSFAKEGNVEGMLDFISQEKKRNPLVVFDYQFPFHAACERGHIAVVQTLLAKNGITDEAISSCVLKASEIGNVAILEILQRKISFEEVVDPGSLFEIISRKGFTPLHHAANGAGGSAFSTLEFLLTKKIDVNKATHEGVTALSLAIQKHDEKCVLLLLSHNADPNIKFKMGIGFVGSGLMPPIFYAVEHQLLGIFTLLFQYKADINVQHVILDPFGGLPLPSPTALEVALGNLDFAKVIMPTHLDSKTATVYMIVAVRKHPTLINSLASEKSAWDLTNNNKSILETLEYFLELGADMHLTVQCEGLQHIIHFQWACQEKKNVKQFDFKKSFTFFEDIVRLAFDLQSRSEEVHGIWDFVQLLVQKSDKKKIGDIFRSAYDIARFAEPVNVIEDKMLRGKGLAHMSRIKKLIGASGASGYYSNAWDFNPVDPKVPNFKDQL